MVATPRYPASPFHVRAAAGMRIDFQTEPARYRHWRIETDGAVASLILDVDEAGGLFEGYALKLNSYDLGVDIELADAIQRLRFEHPEVRTVVLRSGKERVFCAGANIRMLAGAGHAHKVNFCKFTNETRNAIEDASACSGQRWLAAVTGACAGGGYELALAADHILLVDDGASSVSLPELPLLAVLPGTGGLTRVTDKRKVRRDRADLFATTEEGVRGQRALDWKLVDEIAPASRIEDAIAARAQAMAATSDRPADATGIVLGPLERHFSDDGVTYSTVMVELDRSARIATVTIAGPDAPPPADVSALVAAGAASWLLRAARELDDALLHLRFNERDVAVIQFRTRGDPTTLLAHDAFLAAHAGHWLAREIALLWKRTLKRIDLTARSLVALIEPGSCFAGTLAELAFAADRSYMALGAFEGDNRPDATLTLSAQNFGPCPMSNGLTRLQTRFLGDAAALAAAEATIGTALTAVDADALGLVTAVLDDIDWEDEIRIFLEERASFSADALTALEANLRFAGPETMETRIFGRLTAWQNWVFQRPNAVGESGALKRYGTGQKPAFNTERT
jgi:benzoyl-CoA-dihydrodiol lyase